MILKNMKEIIFVLLLFLVGLLIPSVSKAEPTLKLPYPDGVSYKCVQGNNGSYSHTYGSTKYALDFDTPNSGTPEEVVAAGDGTAYVYGGCAGDSVCNGGFGNHIKIDHGDGYYTLYAHLSTIAISNKTYVTQGQVIGKEGTTGNSQGDHIHFGLHYGNPQVLAVTNSVTSNRISVRGVTTGTDSSLSSDQFVCDLDTGNYYLSNNANATSKTVFNFNASSEGWSAAHGINGNRFETGKWVLNTAVDPYIVSPRFSAGIATDQFEQIEVRMSASGKERPYREHAFLYCDSGNGFNETEKLDLGEVSLNGQYKLYRASFSSSKLLKQVRLDPLYSEGLSFTPNDTVKIDFVRLISSADSWDFTLTPRGWSLGNAVSEGFVGAWAWQIQPTTGDPHAISPWLGGQVNTQKYDRLYLRFAVNRDPPGADTGIKLAGNVYFDFKEKDDQGDGFTESLKVPFSVTPDSLQQEYTITLPSSDRCKTIHRIRVDFYEGTADQKYKVYFDKLAFLPKAQASRLGDLQALTDRSTLAATDETGNITIYELADMQVGTNSPIVINASANGSCSNCYNWTLPLNPLGLTADSAGNISGNSGMIAGSYLTTIRAQDPDYSDSYAERSFTCVFGESA